MMPLVTSLVPQSVPLSQRVGLPGLNSWRSTAAAAAPPHAPPGAAPDGAIPPARPYQGFRGVVYGASRARLLVAGECYRGPCPISPPCRVCASVLFCGGSVLTLNKQEVSSQLVALTALEDWHASSAKLAFGLAVIVLAVARAAPCKATRWRSTRIEMGRRRTGRLQCDPCSPIATRPIPLLLQPIGCLLPCALPTT